MTMTILTVAPETSQTAGRIFKFKHHLIALYLHELFEQDQNFHMGVDDGITRHVKVTGRSSHCFFFWGGGGNLVPSPNLGYPQN